MKKKNVSSRKSYGGNLVKGSVKDETNDRSSDGYVKKEVKPENVEFEGGFDTGTNEFRTVCDVERVVPESIIVLLARMLSCLPQGTDMGMLVFGIWIVRVRNT
ncbi:hypothetical protein DY000_02013936 [Brassica cretica]|uniref:Uncharacterized protein n=1 Tax=Brassica cretica TaxID=69181 RepID=A0ABQ7D6I7_BRACR|nr:hypothetical protein DY000_02013936 [Brassica cretica]